jgi:hypothetical protein
MSTHLPIASLDHARRFAQYRGPAHTPAKTAKPAAPQSIGASIAIAILRAVAPGAAAWYWPRRQLIHNELRKLLGPRRAATPAPQLGPRRLRFREF